MAMNGNMQNLIKLGVLHKIASEDRCGNYFVLESRDHSRSLTTVGQ